MDNIKKEPAGPPRKVLVTGASGFIGGHLVEKLLDRGDHVRCLVRRPWKPAFQSNAGRLEMVRGDLSQPATWYDALDGIQYLFHIAGLTSALREKNFFQVNRDGTANLIDALIEKGIEIDRLVYLSSLAAVGPASEDFPAVEETNPHPVSHYGRSKLEGEKKVAALKDSIPWTIIRPPIVYGEREKQLFQFIRMIARGFLPLPAGKERYYSFVHVDDLVSGMLLAAEKKDAAGMIYHMAHREIWGWRDFTAAVARALGKKAFKIPLPLIIFRVSASLSDLLGQIRREAYPFNYDKYRELRHFYWTCDPGKAEKELGFKARTGMNEGLTRTVAWYKEEAWLPV